MGVCKTVAKMIIRCTITEFLYFLVAIYKSINMITVLKLTAALSIRVGDILKG